MEFFARMPRWTTNKEVHAGPFGRVNSRDFDESTSRMIAKHHVSAADEYPSGHAFGLSPIGQQRNPTRMTIGPSLQMRGPDCNHQLIIALQEAVMVAPQNWMRLNHTDVTGKCITLRKHIKSVERSEGVLKHSQTHSTFEQSFQLLALQAFDDFPLD
jgi:hypothetical protein